uniref:ribosomal protein S2 n=1 Tax=Phytophthora hedraiandra TaxID=295481 RepID=UPI0021D52DF6|nr:ribosomal protein S2 [Phytophthora hedraiandra]UXG19060.1 ribosomal protein S2 [Phytophthora cactorum]UXG55676.1 ribosomal protein S2 [Phytophthora cactorum]UXG55714.1 ribosomal protein S2 [Phytophthora cactorum]UXG55908.1 ribosomal protein S2 [Phytophthora hedraiandra]UXG56099.1 ribosomal protein S2 [Phytophthora cactorum]
MIQKNKKKNNNILLNLLFKSKNMYGESLIYTNKEILPFIYGSRYDYTIINLKDVSFFLKRIFKLIKNMLQKNEKILIIGNNNEVQFLLNISFIKKNPNIIFFNKEWVNGLITNKIMNTTFNKVINYLIKENEIKLILIIKSSIKDTFLNQELSILQIPTISLINTSQTIKNINYPIVTNSRNIQSIYTLMYLLRKIF